MTKMELAHDYAMKHLENSKGNITIASLTAFAWQYADAMQAEADKREVSIKELMKDHVHDYIYGRVCACGAVNGAEKEWQPDWSQAPAWANYIAVYSDHCNASYFEKEPKIISGYTWGGTDGKSLLTPIPVYAGNWKESLRKRPQ